VRKKVVFGRNKHKRHSNRLWPCSIPLTATAATLPFQQGHRGSGPSLPSFCLSIAWVSAMLVCEVVPHDKYFADNWLTCMKLTDTCCCPAPCRVDVAWTSVYLDYTDGVWCREEEEFAVRPGGKGGTPFPPEEHIVAQTTCSLEPGIRQRPSPVCGCPEATVPDHMRLRFVPSHRTPG